MSTKEASAEVIAVLSNLKPGEVVTLSAEAGQLLLAAAKEVAPR